MAVSTRLPRSSVLRVAAAVAGLCLVTSCGSTVPLAQQRSLGGVPASAGELGNEGSLPGSTNLATGPSGTGPAAVASSTGGVPAGSPSVTPGGQAGSGTGSGATGGPGGTATGGGPGGSSSGGPIVTGQDGPGVTATTIYIGLDYDPNAAAEDAALGAGGLNPGDTTAETNAMVAYINSHGGIDHRQISVVWAQVSATSSQNIQEQEQAACSTWTTDHKVFVIPIAVPVWDQCASAAHIIGVVDADIAAETTPILRQFPYDFNLSALTLDQADTYTVTGVARQGYFSKGAKVGVVTWDGSDFRYAASQATAQLAAMGYPNVPVEYVSEPQTYGDIGASSGDVSNAILKFRSEGVDHVLIFDGVAGVFSGAGLSLLFMNAAGSQGYTPEYGINSAAGLSALVPDVPSSEIKNAIGVGWEPSIDLDGADFAAYPQPPQAKTCIQIMTAAGQAPSSSNAEGVALGICDEFFFLKFALDRVAGPLNQASAAAAIESVGTSYQSLMTFQDDFTATEHDGPALVRDAAYFSSCTCFRYTTPPFKP